MSVLTAVQTAFLSAARVARTPRATQETVAGAIWRAPLARHAQEAPAHVLMVRHRVTALAPTSRVTQRTVAHVAFNAARVRAAWRIHASAEGAAETAREAAFRPEERHLPEERCRLVARLPPVEPGAARAPTFAPRAPSGMLRHVISGLRRHQSATSLGWSIATTAMKVAGVAHRVAAEARTREAQAREDPAREEPRAPARRPILRNVLHTRWGHIAASPTRSGPIARRPA